MTARLKLFHAYTACTRVTLTALEHIGVPYDDYMVDFRKGEHKGQDFLSINPNGKVPTLLADGHVLTENASILLWLHENWPNAGLFPPMAHAWEQAQVMSDLFWVSASWHPYVRANKVPSLWTTGDVEPVREKGRELLMGVVRQLDERIQHQPWWFGEEWSILDAYFWWAYINAELGGFSLEGLKGIANHRARNEAHPSVVRALARERAAYEALG
jgi:glutathione S-transferase